LVKNGLQNAYVVRFHTVLQLAETSAIEAKQKRFTVKVLTVDFGKGELSFSPLQNTKTRI